MSLLKIGWLGRQANRLRKYLLYGPRSDTRSYIRAMNKRGASINDTLFMSTPETVFLDDTAPWLLHIGEHVCLSAGVKILTHDASWLVRKQADGSILGHMAPVKIGNNVFLGMNTVVLCGVTICDQVIVGANSVVSSSIHTPGVYVGNPARQVAGLDRYWALRESRQVKEAYVLAKEYYHRFGEKPPQEVFHEYFWVFAPRDMDALHPRFVEKLGDQGGREQAQEAFLRSQPDFPGYDQFWEWCLRRIQREGKHLTK